MKSIDSKILAKLLQSLACPQLQKYDVLIGFDSEYRNKEWNIPIEQQTELANYNEIISYQYSAYCLGNNQYSEGIVYCYDKNTQIFKQKKSLGQLLSTILTALNIKRYQLEQKKYKVLLVSHYSL